MNMNVTLTDQDFEPSSSSTQFKHTESNTFEFKVNITVKAWNKYLETLCSFLNNRDGIGGYLIFGIKDDLSLIGVKSSQKEIDQFICKIDSIISNGLIMKYNDTTSSVSNLSPDNIITKQFRNSKGQKFVIVQAVPSLNFSISDSSPLSTQLAIKYQLANGVIFYRLGASNYSEKVEKIYKQADFESQMRTIEKTLKEHNTRNIQVFEKTLTEKKKEILAIKQESLAELEKLKEMNRIYQIHMNTLLKHVSSSPSSFSSSCSSINSTSCSTDSSQLSSSDIFDSSSALLQERANCERVDEAVTSQVSLLPASSFQDLLSDLIFQCFKLHDT
jgi:hypothetical protein